MTYSGGFDTWADVQREFQIDLKEPSQVLYAGYDRDGYDGSAQVVYRQGRRYYVVEGGHCSCYGLEGQFDPTEYRGKRELRTALEKAFPKEAWTVALDALKAS